MSHDFLAASTSSGLRWDLYFTATLALLALLLPVFWVTRLSLRLPAPKGEEELLEELVKATSSAQPKAASAKPKKKKAKRQGEKTRKAPSGPAASAAALDGAARSRRSSSEDADLSAVEANAWSGSEAADVGHAGDQEPGVGPGRAWQQLRSPPPRKLRCQEPAASWPAEQLGSLEDAAGNAAPGGAQGTAWDQSEAGQPEREEDGEEADGVRAEMGGSKVELDECALTAQVGEVGEATAEGPCEAANGLGANISIEISTEAEDEAEVANDSERPLEAEPEKAQIVAGVATDADFEGAGKDFDADGMVYRRELLLAYRKPFSRTPSGPPGLGPLSCPFGPPPGLAPPPGLQLPPGGFKGFLGNPAPLASEWPELPPPPGLGWDEPAVLLQQR